MGILDATDLLPGLTPAAFRGVLFWMPDASHEVGRRVIVQLFPGIDPPAFDDQGRHDGPISITGLLIGDDYQAQELALRAALQSPGVGTLLHPWLGEISVIVAEPAQIHYSSRALRVVTFEASFLRADVAGGLIASTLAGLLSAVAQLAALPGRIISAVMGVGIIAVATWSSLVTMGRAIAGLMDSAVTASPAAAALTEATLTSRAAFAEALAGAPGAASGSAIAAAAGTVVGDIATAAIGAEPSAIGASTAAMTSSTPLDARRGSALMLDLGAAVRALATPTRLALALRLAAEISVVAQAVRVSAEIDYESRQDAASWRDQLGAAIDATVDSATALAAEAPSAAATAIDGLTRLRAALGRDMNEIIGRLPSVVVIEPAAPVSAWLIAQHVAGDDPSAVVPMFDDIVRRNRLAHPGRAAGAIEVLA